MKREYWDLKYLNQIKRDYQQQLQRVEQLPADYKQAFKTITDYLTAHYGGFDGLDLMQAQVQLIDFLSEAAANQVPLATLFGPDIIQFAQDFGHELNIPNWLEKRQLKAQTKINQHINRKLKE